MKNIFNYLSIGFLALVLVLPAFSNNLPHPVKATETDRALLYTEAKLKPTENPKNGSRVFVTVVNKSNQTFSNLRYRYFVNLSGELSREYSLKDIHVTTLANEGRGATQVQRFKNSENIFYVEGSFAGVPIEPNQTKTIEFYAHIGFRDYRGRLSESWVAENDPSYFGLDAQAGKTRYIALYDLSLPVGEQLVWGVEPSVKEQLKRDPLEPVTKNLPETDQILTNKISAIKNVNLSVFDSWATGYCANIDVKPDLTVNDWHVDLSGVGKIYEIWGVNQEEFNTLTRLRPLTPTKNVQAGETVRAGFCAEGQSGNVQVAAAEVTRMPLPMKIQNGELTAEFMYKSAWNTGYCLDIKLENKADHRLKWRAISINLPESSIDTSWGGIYDESGNLLVIRPETWNQILSPGKIVRIGFCGNGPADVEPLFFQ